MKFIFSIAIAIFFSTLTLTLLAFQGRGYEDEEEAPPLPSDAHDNAEWTFARYHFRSNSDSGGFRRFHMWAADYPKADRQFTLGVRRLTRLHARGIEQVVDADSDDLFNWPWIYMEHGNGWNLTDDEVVRLRQYLLKGGFLFSDDTHGDFEWESLAEGLRAIFPERQIEDLKNDDEIFHVMHDLNDRVQIHGTRFLWGGRPYGPDMVTPTWRAIRDDQGRIMVAICHNSDVGDAWEWADSPNYPEKETSLAYRIGINYILFDMTH
jgi:hypothetical protein